MFNCTIAACCQECPHKYGVGCILKPTIEQEMAQAGIQTQPDSDTVILGKQCISEGWNSVGEKLSLAFDMRSKEVAAGLHGWDAASQSLRVAILADIAGALSQFVKGAGNE